MSDSAVTERRIRPIQDAYAAGNFKQALKECEKWQKKGENSDQFLALRAAVLTHQSDIKQQEKGKQETLQLCQREPAISNLKVLDQIQETLRHLSLETQEAPKLWERAAATKVNDRDFLTTWLTRSMSTNSWQSAQKAAMSLRKAFPKDRQYEFWNVLMCYLISKDPKVPEKDRSLFATLASRMILKIGQSGFSEKGISNPEELSLWGTILTGTGNADEVVQQLQNNALNSVVQQDPQLALEFVVEALRVSHGSEATIAFCEKALFSDKADENVYNDDRAWRLLLSKVIPSNEAGTYVKKLDTFLDRHPDCRPAHLAKLDILKDLAIEDAQYHNQLTDSCRSYFELFGTKAYCFDDLVNRLRYAVEEQMNRFQTEIAERTSEPMHRMFALKLEYHILSAKGRKVDDLCKFAIKALDLHESMPKNTTAGAEATFLAAMALVQMAELTKSSHYALQACMILHTCAQKFPEYYPLYVLLLRLQRVLGQPSLSMRNFYQLSIKNLQWETVGYLLLTRISTSCPWRTDLEPLRFLDASLQVFENADRSLDRSIQEGLKAGSYSNIMDAVRVRRNLQYSLSRQIFAIEERKTQRTCGVPISQCLDVQGGGLVDLRDISFMPTYGLDIERIQDYLSSGPMPTHGWIHAMAKMDHLVLYLSSELGGQTALANEALAELRKEKAYTTATEDGMTKAEKQNQTVIEGLTEAILLQLTADASNQKEFDSHLATAQKALQDPLAHSPTIKVGDLILPTWEFLHTHFAVFESLQAVSLFLGVQARKTKNAKGKSLTANRETIDYLRERVATVEKAAHEQVAQLKVGLNASGVLGKLVDVVLGRSEDASSDEQKALGQKIGELQSEAAVEEFCGAMKDSWENALDGILGVKVRLYK